ncbi:MAG: hypothetical protein K0S61_4849 [Anaerocolumna sp.]|jgi:hypothetical protein|nr:hypothetical protein [Anaerocolumna sp.]
MAIVTSGVYPVNNIVFKIGKLGLASVAPTDMVGIKDMESLSFKIDSKTEDWNPMDGGGWGRHLMTSKDLTVSLKGKRSVGDAGNDYIAGLAWKDGLDCSTLFEIDFPDGSKLSFPCVIDVSNPGGGDSTNAAGLEFDAKCDGKPTYTAAA